MLTQQQILEARKRFGISEKGVGQPASPEVADVSRWRQAAAEHDAQKPKEQPSFMGDLKNIGEKRGAQFNAVADRAAGQSFDSNFVQAGGAVLGGAADVLRAGAGAAFRAVTPDAVEKPLRKAGNAVLEKAMGTPMLGGMTLGQSIGALKDDLERIKQEKPELAANIEGILSIADFALSATGVKAGVSTVGKVASKTADVIENTAKNVVQTTKNLADDVVNTVTQKVPKYAEQATKLLANEPSPQLKTILQETPKSKFDDYVRIAEEAANDPRKPSVFETVGEKISEATKQLKSQASSLGAQKSAIIEKAKVGLQEFKEAPRRAILEVMKLEDNPLKDEIINTLKSVKTKLDADKAIDKIQSFLYDAKGTQVIAQGSAVEKQIKGIIGKLNNELKASLPKAYRDLNDKFTERAKVLGTLNRALGEVVEGVPTRGASLIKQFFSPAGTKTKELFDFIKQTTGLDLAQDATVAKFMGEMFNDPKVRSLLEGIPTGRQGLIDKGVDILAEKTGFGQKVKDTIRTGEIQKARDITKTISQPAKEGISQYIFYNKKMTPQVVKELDSLGIKPKESVTLYRDGAIKKGQSTSWSYKKNIGEKPIKKTFKPEEILIDTTDPRFLEMFDGVDLDSLKKFNQLEGEVIVKPF